MLLRARDNNIQSFASIWLNKGIQNEFLKHPKEFVLNSFIKPDGHKTLNKIAFSKHFYFQPFKSFMVAFSSSTSFGLHPHSPGLPCKPAGPNQQEPK